MTMKNWLKANDHITPSERSDRYQRLVEMGCCLCDYLGLGPTPPIIHHLRTGQGKKRASDRDTMPLCPRHHQFSGVGVHDMGRRQFAEMYGISEVELLERVNDRLAQPDINSFTKEQPCR